MPDRRSSIAGIVERPSSNPVFRLLFSPTVRKKPGPRGPSRDVVAAVLDMKRRNPTWGLSAHRAADRLGVRHRHQQRCVRRILAARYRPEPDSAGPSWLTLLGHAKDSLWSLDLFCCESAILRTHWVLVVMDQFTRRILGFGVHRGVVDGVALCRRFNRATRGQTPPTYVSTDHDRLYRFSQWQRNLRILDVQEIKSVPYAPLSHPFVERLIGTIRRECLDRTLFWTTADLEMKLLDFQRITTATARMPGWPDTRQRQAPTRPRTRDSQFVPLAGALSLGCIKHRSPRDGSAGGWKAVSNLELRPTSACRFLPCAG